MRKLFAAFTAAMAMTAGMLAFTTQPVSAAVNWPAQDGDSLIAGTTEWYSYPHDLNPLHDLCMPVATQFVSSDNPNGFADSAVSYDLSLWTCGTPHKYWINIYNGSTGYGSAFVSASYFNVGQNRWLPYCQTPNIGWYTGHVVGVKQCPQLFHGTRVAWNYQYSSYYNAGSQPILWASYVSPTSFPFYV